MTKQRLPVPLIRRIALTVGVACISTLVASGAEAALTFTGVAAGDATSNQITLWTRAVDDAAPASAVVTMQVSTDPGFARIVATSSAATSASTDNTLKFAGTGLRPSTLYYYRFKSGGITSIVGRFKTAPEAHDAAPVHFALSGDNDGLMRPYALASVLPAENLDFYINLGDVIYETASNVSGNNGASWLNSPSVTLSNDSLSFNGVPRPCNSNAPLPCTASTAFATQAQLFADYSKKYRENLLPVNTSGQNSLQVLYVSQGNYTTWDNHELGNRKYIDGGAPAGLSIGGTLANDMASGRGIDARAVGTCSPGCANDVNTSTLAVADFMNRSIGFKTLRQVFLNYMPIADLGVVDAVSDPRSHGTPQLYSAHQWGRHVIYINTDSRSYRDIRLKTATAAADDTTSPRADNPGRTYLGVTQLAWLEQTLLDAEENGTTWKFVSVSDPVDQIGAIGGGTDSGKSYIGGYRAERNALLKFIADHHIVNVVFLSTDDHQNRINEVTYSPTGETGLQSTYVKVPYCFSVVAGPLGATGPDLIANHSFSNLKALADTLVSAESAAGVEPIGLEGYPGLHDLFREGDPLAATHPQAIDFYSPDTFNFTVFDVSKNGKTLTVETVGMNSTAINTALEYDPASPARVVLSFKIRAEKNGKDDKHDEGNDDSN